MEIRKLLLRSKNNRGFTLVELMIVVAIIGVLAALAIYGVTKYVANAKTAEARTAVGRIAKDAAAAWDREQTAAGLIAAGTSAAITRQLCASADKPVPENLSDVAGKKYQSTAANWTNDVGWACLRFSMQGPQYFQYDYSSDTSTAFVASAHGDLDADGIPSTFKILGGVSNDGGEDFIRTSAAVEETDPEE